MESHLDISELVNACPNVIISVKAEDLKAFARQLIAEARQELKRELAKDKSGEETLLDADMVKKMLGVSDSTLYRLSKANLIPVWVGGQRRWKKSDVLRMLERR